MKQFTIINNTDGVDIREKSLGLDVRFDTLSPLHRDRGLHIQIRHNGDQETFEVANSVARVLSASTALLEALKFVMAVNPGAVYIEYQNKDWNEKNPGPMYSEWDLALEAIKKAEGSK